MTTAIDPTKMSTQPAAVAPDDGQRRTILQRLLRSWRLLTSMRTALILLFMLALAAIPGTLLPQRGLNPVRVTGFFVHHPWLAPKLDRLKLFDVFASPWFGAIYLLLFISLAGCVLPRLRVHWRALRTPPPKVPRHLHRLAFSDSWETDLEPDKALETARMVLKRRRWQTRLREDGLASESGRQRETGNLVFHASLILLLAGIALGSVYGYSGTVLVVDGGSFTNTVTSYDQFKPGRLTKDSSLQPFSFTLDQFDATYQPGGEPKTFDAHLSYQRSLNGPTKKYDLRVNKPLRFGSSVLYLLGHGYAIHVSVKDKTGQVIFDDNVPCLPENAVFTSICTIKVPDTANQKQQLGFTGFFFPTGAVDGSGVISTSPADDNPVLQLTAYSGDLGLNSGIPQSVYNLDTTNLKQGPSTVLALAQKDSADHVFDSLPGGATMTVSGVSQWGTFQVKKDPAKLLVLAAAILMVLGLIASLFIKRRRLWVRATPSGSPDSRRSLIEVGGLSRTDADGFQQTFLEIMQEMRMHSQGDQRG